MRKLWDDRRPSWQDIATESQALKAYWAQWNSLVREDDVLTRVLESDDGTVSGEQMVVPKSKMAEVLWQLHDGSLGGHLGVSLGVRKTLQKEGAILLG